MTEQYQEIIAELRKSYAMELETVTNYLQLSINLDGIRAEEVKKDLETDIQEELMHAQRLGQRIKTIEGVVPGSLSLDFSQSFLQPPENLTDLVSVIKGVIKAEETACAQYEKIIRMCDGVDYVTQDLCIELLGMEQEHRRHFRGFLKEYEG